MEDAEKNEEFLNEEENNKKYIDEDEPVFEEDLFMDSDIDKNKEEKESKKGKENVQEDKEKEIEIEEASQKDLESEKIDDKKEKEEEKKEVKKSKNNNRVKKMKKNKSKKSKKSHKNTKKSKKNSKKNSGKKRFLPILLSIVGIIIIIGAVFFMKDLVAPKEDKVVAVVNGENIMESQLDKEYEFFFLLGGLPEEYKEVVTRKVFLNNSLISETLLLQEAEAKGLSVTEQEAQQDLEETMANAGITMEEFSDVLGEKGLTMDEANDYFRKQILSYELLNKTILRKVEVGDAEVLAAYAENKELFDAQNMSLEDVEGDIREMLLIQKQRETAQRYMNNLRKKAEVEISYNTNLPTGSTIIEEPIVEEVEETKIETFKKTEDLLCAEEGKPLVIMFSTTTCPHCAWVGDTFDKVVNDYNNIAAYHWQLDQGDNVLTEEKETNIPKEHINILKEYNPEGYVPAFVIGCKYYRIGNGYERTDDLESKEAELRAAINSIV